MPTVVYSASRAIVRPLVRLFWNPTVTGRENIPREGAFLVASNHLANVDSFLIPVVVDRQLSFVSKDDFWKKPGPIGRIQRWYFDQIGVIPLDREALSSGKGALQAGLEILRRGGGFAIYPEGTRSKDGLLHPGKQGAAWLALESGAPVLPIGLVGTPELFRGRRLFARGKVAVHIGTPIELDDIDPSLSKGVRRRMMTERIMEEIQALSGQRRSDVPLPDVEEG